MANSSSVLLTVRQVRIRDDYTQESTQVFGGNDESESCTSNAYTNTNYNYYCIGVKSSGAGYSYDSMVIGLAGIVGAAFVPKNTPNGTSLSGSFIFDYTTPKCAIVRVFGANETFDSFCDNPIYYKDSQGYYHLSSNGDVVATPSQVSNLPSNVEFNGWFDDGNIIIGDDGKYYKIDGSECFSNLPSGVIPVNLGLSGIYGGSDGNYYDIEGDEILENLPSGVTPASVVADVVGGSDGKYYDFSGDEVLSNLPTGVVINSKIGNLYSGSDGRYYNISGDRVMGNLPDDVSIVSYDSINQVYEGSDGKFYDINGDEISQDGPCSGVSVNRGNTVRFTITGVDVFGNDFSFTKDVIVGASSLNLSENLDFNPLKKIKGIACRNISNGESIGNSRLKIRGLIVGFRVGVDIDTLDPDVVLGNYDVCECIFHTCSLYSDVSLDGNLPLGITPNTSTIDVGFYCLGGNLELQWNIDSNTVFPFCCSSQDTSEKNSGSTSDNQINDLNDVVESLDKINDSLKKLVEAVNNVSFEAIIENGLYCDIRKKYYEPLPVDDTTVEDG